MGYLRFISIVCLTQGGQKVCKVAFVCLFVQGYDRSIAWQIKSVFAEFPGLLMRHEAIEMVFAHICQGQKPPTHHNDELGVSA